MADIQKIKDILAKYSRDERRTMFDILRQEFPIHQLEEKLNTSAEIILEAIDRASDLTLRGIRGIIAEAAFQQSVVHRISSDGWVSNPITGDHPYDFLVSDTQGQIKIQVKMQRQKQHRPMMAFEANKTMFRNSLDFFVVETQKTRGGNDSAGGSTRPYRFGEFDLLAVSLHPSTNDWNRFIYSVSRWLIPTPNSTTQIFKYQPVPKQPNDDWTEDFNEAVGWLRSNIQKTIRAN